MGEQQLSVDLAVNKKKINFRNVVFGVVISIVLFGTILGIYYWKLSKPIDNSGSKQTSNSANIQQSTSSATMGTSEYILYQDCYGAKRSPSIKLNLNVPEKAQTQLSTGMSNLTISSDNFELSIGSYCDASPKLYDGNIEKQKVIGSIYRIKSDNYYYYDGNYTENTSGQCNYLNPHPEACGGSVVGPLVITCYAASEKGLAQCDNIVESLSYESGNWESEANSIYAPIEISLKYWTQDINSAAIVKISAPETSLVSGEKDKPTALQLSNGSKLEFSVVHASEVLEFQKDQITKVNTKNYENIFRLIYGGKMVYANLTTEGNCGTYEKLADNNECTTPLVDGICHDVKKGTYQAPCGYSTFHGIIISCENSNNDYSLCDKVMSTMGEIKMFKTVSFEIKSVLVNPALSANTLSFTSNTTLELAPKIITDTVTKLSANSVDVYIVAGLGESGGIHSYVPEYKILHTRHFGSDVARVNILSNGVFFKDVMGTIPPDEKTYFYTSSFTDQCPNSSPSQICSWQEISSNNQNFGVYCITGSDAGVEVCDDFVKNLSFGTK